MNKQSISGAARLTEANALQRVGKFEELTRRGVQLDSFLWDDGWDDPKALWEFDRAKFPGGFAAVAARAKQLGAGLGVWLSRFIKRGCSGNRV